MPLGVCRGLNRAASHVNALPPQWGGRRRNPLILLELPVIFRLHPAAMIELNPIRQRIADLQERLASLRGYL